MPRVRLGDWDGEGGAGPVSFQVVRRRGAPVIVDLVVAHQTTCKTSSGAQRSTALGQLRRAIPIARNGAFRYRSAVLELSGRFLDGAVRGRWAEPTLRLPAVAGEPPATCSTQTVLFRAAPQRRIHVRDGRWSGVTAEGQPVSFSVSLDGRILSNFSIGASKPVTSTGVSVTETSSSGGQTTTHSRELTGETSEFPCWIGYRAPNPEAFISPRGSVSVELSTTSDPKGTEVPDLTLSVTFASRVAHGSYAPTGDLPSDPCLVGGTFTARP